MINKSEFILNLYKMINEYNQKKYNNKTKIFKNNDIKKIKLKKLFNEKINELVKKYYTKIVNYMESQSLNGKNSGIIIIQKDNFKISIVNNPASRNLELVMRQILKDYYNTLCGLEYQIWNQNNNLYLKLVW